MKGLKLRGGDVLHLSWNIDLAVTNNWKSS